MTIDTERYILEKGAELIRRNGFNNTGLSMILKAAGVPRGSFYYYFKNKVDFGLRLIEYLHDSIKPVLYGFLTGECDTPPLERLREFFAYFRRIFTNEEIMSGCPIGNISQEMAASNPRFREKLADVFDNITNPVVICLKHAVEKGELSGEEDVLSLAKFIVNSWQGALIALKVSGTAEPLMIFERFVFDELLRFRATGVQVPETERTNLMSWELTRTTP
ncbi:MAG: TetR family transcriptional regulator C-terminal domain-containing protein [Candidatus Aegiribacteria sp.]|nr:TetR family transcriptional regulator C-terminal domain-containing protein [Candidatus Aegiribacteria sp.]